MLNAADDACSSLTNETQTQNSSVGCPVASCGPAGTTTDGEARPGVVASRSTVDDDDAGCTRRIPDSVWSEFTETFRVIELAVSEGLRCSIDAPPPPPTTFQPPELDLSADVAPVDGDNRQYSVQLTHRCRDVSARRQCEYDVTCAAFARRRDGDDVRYAVSYNRWITVARQPAAVARQPPTYEPTNKQSSYDTSAMGSGGGVDYKWKDEYQQWGGCAAGETADSWISPAVPTVVKQEQSEEWPSCAYQLWRDDSAAASQSLARGPRCRPVVAKQFKDCRYAAVPYNKVRKTIRFILSLI